MQSKVSKGQAHTKGSLTLQCNRYRYIVSPERYHLVPNVLHFFFSTFRLVVLPIFYFETSNQLQAALRRIMLSIVVLLDLYAMIYTNTLS